MIATVIVHLAVVFLMKAYRKPWEVTWWSGLFMLSMVLGLAFTGSLLPWDTRAYFATLIGTEIPKSIPVVGGFLVTLLRGGEYVGDETLKRFFALHAVILPLTALLGLALHLILNQVHPTSVPLSLSDKELPSRSYLKEYLNGEVLLWLVMTVGVVLLAFGFPAGLGTKADPYASAPVGVKPDWYFLALFQTLRMLPMEVAGVNAEIFVHIGLMLLAGLLVTLPFWDRSVRLGKGDLRVKVFGAVVAIYWISATLAGMAY
jgi:cytochrome b6